MDELEGRQKIRNGDDRTLAEPERQTGAQAAAENRRIEALYANAAARQGYSAYESAAITSKQA